jgi:hypothetical protein
MSEHCPRCKKWTHGGYDDGLCDDCIDHGKPLIKSDDHYVRHSYRHYLDGSGDAHEDENASLPTITWDEHRKKWKVSFQAADCGGYDVFICEWWFDTKEDIINHMRRQN